MAKTKPSKEKKQKKKEKSLLNRVAPSPIPAQAKPSPSTSDLCAAALLLLQEGNLADALSVATHALKTAQSTSNGVACLAPLNLLGEIHVEIGDIDAARQFFEKAVELDSNGDISEEKGGGAEKFLWLAQLSEEGGKDSVVNFQKGAEILRRQIASLLSNPRIANSHEGKEAIEEKRRKLATALCGIVEVYMTDLSWEEDAEKICEGLVTEATMVSSSTAEPWQTLASVRISQTRLPDARAALTRSLSIWKDLPPSSELIPDFPTRVSLARLLMEAEMEDEALEVLERLVGEDDQSVEVWYLGGWGLYVVGEKTGDDAGKKVAWLSGRRWLRRCLELFGGQGYEDERLGDHARELVGVMDGVCGKEGGDDDDDDDDDDGEEWEEEDGDDVVMEG